MRSLCQGSLRLPDGSLTFGGLQLTQPTSSHDATFAITGGSHAYADARGVLLVDAIPNSSQQDWSFRFTPSATPPKNP